MRKLAIPVSLAIFTVLLIWFVFSKLIIGIVCAAAVWNLYQKKILYGTVLLGIVIAITFKIWLGVLIVAAALLLRKQIMSVEADLAKGAN